MRLDTLTSLRFFAAAAIVIGHAHSSFGSAGLAISFPLDQGVSFFFVLSGFILAYTYPNLREVSSVRHFWIARFARIWPAHLATLLLVTIVAPNMPPVEHRLSITLANILLLQSWLPFRDSILSYNGVAWSISTEFFFYLCFPVLIHNWQKNWYLKLLFTAA